MTDTQPTIGTPTPGVDRALELIINLPVVDAMPDDVRQAAADYDAACDAWSEIDTEVEQLAGQLANADNEDAHRVAAAVRDDADLAAIALVDRADLEHQHRRAELARRARTTAIARAHQRLVRLLAAHRPETLIRTRANVDQAAQAYTDALTALRRARVAYHRAAAEHAWHADVGTPQHDPRFPNRPTHGDTWDTYTGRIPAARLAEIAGDMANADTAAGRLISEHTDPTPTTTQETTDA